MKLYQLLSKLDRRIPVIIVENSSLESSDGLQNIRVIYDSLGTCTVAQFCVILFDLFGVDYNITHITLSNDLPVRLKINVVRA